ncbi:MAG: DNA translocase FtsK [Dehalococcoidia bacterium]|nr:DNA translocase FtsK [Dehalococcoidia bacterium]
MARTRTRRRRTSRGSTTPPVPDILTVGRGLARPEVVGTLLVVIAAAAVPYLVPPLADLLRDARDGLVRTFGLHVFTLTALIATIGLLLALRRGQVLRDHRRHMVGLVALLGFAGGLLGRWRPDTEMGGVDLAVHSAGGDLGRLLSGGWVAAVIWLLLFAAGFGLLWPRTAAALVRATPGAVAAGAAWLWALGLHRAAWNGARNTVRGLRHLAVRSDGNSPAFETAIAVDVDDIAGPATPSLAGEEAEAPADPKQRRKPVQIGMDMETPADALRHSADGWQLPPTTLLTAAEQSRSRVIDNQRRAQLIVDTLDSFGVDSSVVQINEGPTVTQFGVEPGWDVKTKTVVERDVAGQPILDRNGQQRTKDVEVSRTRIRVNRITALQNDLALALAAPALRIEAPVPGKPMVGIEVPNHSTSLVGMRQIMESPAYQKARKGGGLPIALGAGVSGDPVVADLTTMPHLLIAGATGAGKSVCLNAIISCLLMNYSPEELRLVMIDPKRVEMTAFQEIPHLAFSEIVVEMDRVVGTLQAVINEMESRYRRFAKAGVRNIKRYNETADKKIPYWVVIIDELADLMLAAPYQVENQLVRLAQLARATGIHLVVATQRPSVDVITGLIKANFPTRIAFAVSSSVDSRTILDQGGAEKLLGKGDMLYVPPDAQKPKRVQGVFVADPEIESVVSFWTHDRFSQLVPEKFDTLLEEAERQIEESSDGASSAEDTLLSQAIEIAREHRTLSTSMLQRKLGIGYPRAARLMDDLESRGVVGPQEGGRSREVLVGEPGAGVESLAAAAAAFEPPALPEVTEEAPPDPPKKPLRFPRPFDAE